MRIIGCDLHARQQTVAMLDTETGEVEKINLQHEGNNVREFYSTLPRPVRVGIAMVYDEALPCGAGRAKVFCLSWKWRKRSSVKITERTHEETTEALHAGREGRHSEEAFGGRSADLGPV